MTTRSTLLILTLLCVACGDTPANPRGRPRTAANVPSKTLKLEGPPGLPSVVIAELMDEKSDAHFARNGANGVLLTNARRRWLSGPVRVDKGDAAVAEEQPRLREIAPAPREKLPYALRALGKGFLLVWLQAAEAGYEVWALSLDESGAPRGEPSRASQAYDAVSWVDVLVHDAQAMLLWEVRRGDVSDVVVAPWTGEKSGEAMVAAQGVSGWQAIASRAGAAVAWVTGGDAGKVGFIEVGRDRRTSNPLTLSSDGSAMSDVQLAALSDRYVVAWTDRADGDPHVLRADVSIGGTLAKAATPAVAPVGGQALIALLSNHDHSRVLLAWEAVVGVTGGGRTIRLASIDEHGIAARAELDYHGTSEGPQIIADGGGFAALTIAPSRLSRAKADDPAPFAPFYVRFDRQLRVRAAEPVRIDELAHQGVGLAGVPQSIRSLHCEKELCSVVATGSGEPALMSLVTLPLRRSDWVAPARPAPAESKPSASAVTTLADMPAALADVSSVTLSDGRQLIAWVTHHAQTREQGPAEPAATLAYRFIDGGKAGPVHVLSERAISIGGVKAIALPTGEHPKKNDAVAVLAWAGPNAGSSQVFVTKIGATGAKLLQKTVTTVTRKGGKDGAPPNEVFDIDIALTDKGNMVCTWSDTRDGNAEIYAARLDGNLQRRNADRRMTTTPGPSLEPAVVVVGEQILLAWSEAASDGAPAEVLFMPLDGGLEPSRQSARLLETATHSRGVQWVGTERGALALSWLEDGDGARLVALDDGGAVRGVPRKLTLSESAALSSLSVRCTARGCRGVVAASVSRQLLFGGFETTLDAGGTVRARSMAALTSGGADPALSSSVDVGSIFFVDNADGVRLRALHVVW